MHCWKRIKRFSFPSKLTEEEVDRDIEKEEQRIRGEVADPARHISPLRPHDLRHTFAVHLARELARQGRNVRYELERRLGHRSDQYLALYTNPPEEEAAGFVEKL
ncbi:tyrosine-type recombinase/integrase [Thermoactinomyces sp. CICC 10521]|uniref:tyrosine-type recombinase/integrase n=1 Tax=Thermoactinomyces sp. CICC 10521 TaxID=2767426 RepID=UPI0018DD9FC4|nr:tyrosine-type recombinase/integrase [Thermoactinomyces sp. CICC 10521]MBH8608751.1 tyrosine-type recombinase/integrase [Thermoactinomyces sp. CICC 10521]